MNTEQQIEIKEKFIHWMFNNILLIKKIRKEIEGMNFITESPNQVN